MLSGQRSRISATQGTPNLFASFSPAVTTKGEGEERICIEFSDFYEIAAKSDKTADVIFSAVVVRGCADKDAFRAARKGAFKPKRIAFIDEFSRIVVEVATENDRLITLSSEFSDNPVVVSSLIENYSRALLMYEPESFFHDKSKWLSDQKLRATRRLRSAQCDRMTQP